MSKRKIAERVAIHEGSGNVYRDLGFPDAEEMLVKAQLVYKIREIVRSKRLTQVEASKILGLTQSKLSGILRGQSDRAPCYMDSSSLSVLPSLFFHLGSSFA